MVGLLLRSKFYIWKNSLFRGGTRRVISRLVWYGLSIYLFVVVVQGTHKLFSLVRIFAPTAGGQLLNTFFAGLFTLALFWGIGTNLNQLFLRSDMELLLSLPIMRWDIFVLKLAEATWSNLTAGLLGVAAGIGFGWAAGVPWFYYPWLFIAVVMVLSMLVSLSMLLIMLTVRVLPARRARDLSSLLFTLVFGVLWFGWMIISQRGESMTFFLQHQETMARLGASLRWLPTSWLAASLEALSSREWGALILNGVLLLAGTLLMIALTYRVYNATFYHSWATFREMRPTVRRPAVLGRQRLPLLARLYPWPAREMAIKDWAILRRDPRWLNSLIMPLIVGAFYIYWMGFRQRASLPAGAEFWMATLLCPFVAWFFALTVSVPAIGAEGRNIELVRSLPLSAGALMTAKAAATAPFLLASSALVTAVLGVLLRLPTLWFWLALAQNSVLAVLFAIAGIAAGSVDPQYLAEHPRRSVGIAGTYLSLFLFALLAVSQLALSAGLMLALAPDAPTSRLVVTLWTTEFQRPPSVPLVLGTVSAVYGIALGAVAAVWEFGRRHLERWQPGQ
ncbi:MAG: putative ABC transporter permease subunit [Anaerolineae bacterium]